MGRSNFGHVRQRDNGRWQARHQTADGRQHSATFDSYDDAHSWLRLEAIALGDRSWIDRRDGRISFADWSHHWREAGTRGLRPSTVQRDLEYLERYLLPAFGDYELGDLEAATVDRFVGDMSARLAPATVHKAAQILSKILDEAVRARRIPTNPAAGVRLPKVEREEMRFLTPAEVRKLADTMVDQYRAAVYLGAYAGLRAGEMFGLRVGRLNGAVVEVGEIVTEVAGRQIFGPPKTRAGRRRVQLPGKVADMLAEHVVGKPADAHVFEAPLGGPVRLASWRSRYWRPATAAAGLDGLRVHDLRHTAVALWIAAGASPLEVARRAGHSSVSVVLDRYGHLLPGTEDKLAASLDDMVD